VTPRRRIVCGVWLLLAAPAARALADTSLSVAVLYPPDDLVIAESATRLAAEFTSAGAAVVKAACVVDDDQCSPAKRTAGAKTGARTAEVKLWRAKGAATILVTYWRDPDTAVQKRFIVTPFDETRGASFLAIQAFDLFQLAAGLTVVKRDGPAADTAASVVETVQPGFAIELGGAVIPSTGGGLGVAGGPALHAWFLRPRHLALALALVGPAYSSRLEGAQGSASLRQESASLLVCYRPFAVAFANGRVQPSVCGGGGIYHGAIDGRASQPARNLSQGHWTAFADLGLGTFVRISEHFMLSLQARTWWLKRYPQILIGGAKVGETGNPALLLVASVGRVF
jgi:hypothetical protein